MKGAQSAAGDEAGWGSDSCTRLSNCYSGLCPVPRPKLGSLDSKASPFPHRTHTLSCLDGETETIVLTLPDLEKVKQGNQEKPWGECLEECYGGSDRLGSQS